LFNAEVFNAGEITSKEAMMALAAFEKNAAAGAADQIYSKAFDENGLKLDLLVNAEARIIIMHNRPFRRRLSWIEFNLNSSKLDFVMSDGKVRDLFGLPVDPQIAAYMQNAYQILMVLVNDETGEPEEGFFVPLIIHRA
jgi:hypothetical protein